MSYRRAQRTLLISLLGFGGISAVGGAIGLLTGGLQIETSELEGPPFSDFTIPALILGIIGGGSQLVAFAGLLRRVRWEILGAGVAGVIMVGWIAGEVILIGSDPGIIRNLQLLYLVLGLAEVGLAAFLLQRAEHPASPVPGPLPRDTGASQPIDTLPNGSSN